MREILEELNERSGNSGSMVITPDGILVASKVSEELEEESLAAFASSLLITLKRSVAKLGTTSGLSHCTLTASNGAVMFVDMQNSFLVVIGDTSSRLDPTDASVQDAIDRIKNRRVA